MMQVIVSGLIVGCVYGLAALGLVLIYKTTDVINFAHGEIGMVSTYVSFFLLSAAGLHYGLSFFLALIFSALLGMLIYLVVMKRVQQAPHLHQMVVTLALFLILNGAAGFIWGHHPTDYPEAIKGAPLKIGGVYVTPHEIFVACLTLILMGAFFVLFRYTRIGLAMQAASQDGTAARLMGIKVTQVNMMSWMIGAVLGAVAGVLTAPLVLLSLNMMMTILIMAFAAAVLGGFVSLVGAVVGGLIIGVFENLISFYIAPELKLVYTFALIVLMLYIRPQGILGGGKKAVKKV